MEYKSLTTDEQAELYRMHLKQAEADHFLHSLQVEEAEIELNVMPNKTKEDKEARLPVEANINQLKRFRDVAGNKAKLLTDKMSAAKIPVVKPEPVEADAQK